MPSPAGDTADILPRVIASKLRELYPASVVAENRTGVGGNIVVVFRAEPDGRTLLATVPNVLVVNPRLPVRNVAEFITCLKASFPRHSPECLPSPNRSCRL